MPFDKMGDFSFNHIDQQDDLYKVMDAQEVKSSFDSRGEDLKDALNNLIEQLSKKDKSSSGANNIGFTPILNSPADIQGAIEWLKKELDGAVLGQFPTGTVVSRDYLDNVVDVLKNDYVAHPANGGTTAGTSTAYICNSSPNPAILVDKIGLVFTAHVDSGANPTLKWGALTAYPIKGKLKKDVIYTIRFNATTGNFIVQGEGGEYGNVIASDVRLGKIFGHEDGLLTGTLNLNNLLAGNIKEGVNIAGVIGELTQITAGETALLSNLDVGSWNVTSPNPVLSTAGILVAFTGSLRIKYNHSKVGSYDSGSSAHCSIYINGIQRGTIRDIVTDNTSETFIYNEDFIVKKNDIIRIGAWAKSFSNRASSSAGILEIKVSTIVSKI